MSTNKAKEFFDKLTSDPKAQELFVNKEKPDKPEEMIKAYADAAKQLGYELTAEDIADYFKEKEQEIKSGTESAAKAIEKLPDEKLDNVAGGRHRHACCIEKYYMCTFDYNTHNECKDTFWNGENCWFNDGCDHVINSYDNYICYNSLREYCPSTVDIH